ncbi:MAG TPA: glycosyltransferase [Candidatus Obscuribacterales bacterium]
MSFSDSQLKKIRDQLERSQSWLENIQSEIESSPSESTLPLAPTKPTQPPPSSILFYRDYGGFTGGHLKVWDYFNHVTFSPRYSPSIYFTPQSSWDRNNPWFNLDKKFILSQPLANPDLIFMEGLDWQLLDQNYKHNSPVPIINLIQHVRHGYPDNPRYPFLQYKAIRICVSPEIKQYLEAHAQVNGELLVIPCGLDLTQIPESLDWDQKDYDILIAALKEPELGQELKQKLEITGQKVELLTHQLSRSDYLEQLNRAKITVFLPNQKEGEGFYLPALEGMAVGTLVICPDCIGNRSFCLPGYNCLRPDYRVESLLNAIQQALQYSQTQVKPLLTQAKKTANEHNLLKERQAFLEILNQIHEIW